MHLSLGTFLKQVCRTFKKTTTFVYVCNAICKTMSAIENLQPMFIATAIFYGYFLTPVVRCARIVLRFHGVTVFSLREFRKAQPQLNMLLMSCHPFISQ